MRLAVDTFRGGALDAPHGVYNRAQAGVEVIASSRKDHAPIKDNFSSVSKMLWIKTW